jgi:hypothetical protein
MLSYHVFLACASLSPTSLDVAPDGGSILCRHPSHTPCRETSSSTLVFLPPESRRGSTTSVLPGPGRYRKHRLYPGSGLGGILAGFVGMLGGNAEDMRKAAAAGNQIEATAAMITPTGEGGNNRTETPADEAAAEQPPSGGSRGGSGSSTPKLLPAKGQTTRKVPEFDRRKEFLNTLDSSKNVAGLDHVTDDHAPRGWSNQALDKSKFTQEAWNDLRSLVRETVEKGDTAEFRQSEPGAPAAGVVYQYKFNRPIGVTKGGKAIFGMKVVIDANNQFVTAFPIKL